ncbi:hypothetical protein BC827DRAFT_1159672 [Russula dissimulans]|nr:hypothetical protein BC827DRAFT_1159672 [Russula dissimulans]
MAVEDNTTLPLDFSTQMEHSNRGQTVHGTMPNATLRAPPLTQQHRPPPRYPTPKKLEIQIMLVADAQWAWGAPCIGCHLSTPAVLLRPSMRYCLLLPLGLRNLTMMGTLKLALMVMMMMSRKWLSLRRDSHHSFKLLGHLAKSRKVFLTCLSQQGWPAETDLFLILGSNKVALSVQKLLIQVVVTEAIDNVRATLLFHNVFPDGARVATSIIEDCLLAAAEKHKLATLSIHDRLQGDCEYMKKLVGLPRGRIALFRGEVKERCTMHALSAFTAIAPAVEIVRAVERQLLNYTYIFPGANGHDGVVKCEVPIAIVALVATALYVALVEWCTGQHQLVEFAGSRFLDVYKGHIHSLEDIQKRRVAAFHGMMGTIYSEASQAAATESIGVPPLELDLDNLEEYSYNVNPVNSSLFIPLALFFLWPIHGIVTFIPSTIALYETSAHLI